MTLWVRYAQGAAEGFGVLEGEAVAVHAGEMLGDARPTGESLALADLRLLAPVRPGAFIGLWNNFHAAAAKQGNAIPEFPLYFLKNPRCVIGPGEAIRPPAGYDGKVLYEGELGLVIGRRVSNADEAEGAGAIFGLACGNDVRGVEVLTGDGA